VKLPLQRRIGALALQKILGSQSRIEAFSVEDILSGFSGGKPKSGYTKNIQGNLALSANKSGLRIEPMKDYRARRKNVH
jgi:tRNA(Ile)-lysidine synthase